MNLTKKLLLCICGALFLSMIILTSTIKPYAPLIQFTFSHNQFFSIFNQWTETSKSIFINHFYLDYVFLCCYGYIGFLSFLKTDSRKYIIPTAALCDFTENTLHIFFIKNQNFQNEYLFFISGSVSTIKWFLLLLGIVFIFKTTKTRLTK